MLKPHPLLLTAAFVAALRRPGRRQTKPATMPGARKSATSFTFPTTCPRSTPKVWSTFSPTPGVLADRVTYATADGMIVPAIVYRPDPKVAHWKGKLPGIVIVNGHGCDKFGWYAFYSRHDVRQGRRGRRHVRPHRRRRAQQRAQEPRRVLRRTTCIVDARRQPTGRCAGAAVAGLMQVDLAQAVSYLSRSLRSIRNALPLRATRWARSSRASKARGTRASTRCCSPAAACSTARRHTTTRNKLPCQGPPYHSLLQTLGDRSAVLFALHADCAARCGDERQCDTVMDIPHHGPDWFEQAHAGLRSCWPITLARRQISSPRSSIPASATAHRGWTATAWSG